MHRGWCTRRNCRPQMRLHPAARFFHARACALVHGAPAGRRWPRPEDTPEDQDLRGVDSPAGSFGAKLAGDSWPVAHRRQPYRARPGERPPRRASAGGTVGQSISPTPERTELTHLRRLRKARVALALVDLLLLGTSVVAAQDRLEPGTPAPTGTYRRPLGHDPATLDPARISDMYSLSVTHQIFDGLVRFDQTLTISPALAQYWRASRDGLTWTFMLRHGVKFHHGREVTAEDVIYSLTRLLDPRTRSAAADLFTGIKGAQEFTRGQ